ncbi:MAG: DUF1731 domain-containing protein [Bacteroidetes bacterium]|nr:MAG: DUF1731 domain-containing protein [Bacteroidota bacterium]
MEEIICDNAIKSFNATSFNVPYQSNLRLFENSDIQSPVNFASPRQVTMKEFAKAMGKALHRPSLYRVPELMLRIAVGESADMLVNSKHVVPKVSLEKNYKYKYKGLNFSFIHL